MNSIILADTPTKPDATLSWLREDYLPAIGHNYSRAERELGMSAKTVRTLAAGTYSGDLARQVSKLEEQRVRLSSMQDLRRTASGVVPTELLRRVWAACDAAKAGHLINWVVGVSQIGKTTAARAYRDRYPETTVLLRLPVRPTLTSALAYLADALRLQGKRRSVADTLRRLAATLTPRHLIIVDEANLACDTSRGAEVLDALRELFDRSGCGVVLMVTDLRGSIVTESEYAGRLEQLVRRGLWEVLPSAPSEADVRLIWENFGLPEPDRETAAAIGALARDTCLGELTNRLRLAQAAALTGGRELCWDDFRAALRRLSRRPDSKIKTLF